MIVRTINTVEGFKALEPAWQELQAQCLESSFFNSFDFCFVWWQIYGNTNESGNSRELTICVVELDSSVVAIAPLYKARSQLTRFFNMPTLRFIGRGADTAPDDLDVLLCTDQATASDAVKLLHSHWNDEMDVQRLLFEELPEQSRFYTLSCQWTKCLIENRQSRPVAELPDSWSNFNAGLSRNTRKRIKHRRNRLREAETLSLTVCKTYESMQNALVALIDLHKMRLIAKGMAPAFNSPEYIRFHETLIETLHLKEGVQLITLSDGDQIVGVEYMYCHNGALLFNQTGFDPKYEPVSPGHNMMVFAIENAIENGFKKIDLLKGDYSYKRSYAATIKNSITVSNYRSLHWRLLAGCLNLVRTLKHRKA